MCHLKFLLNYARKALKISFKMFNSTKFSMFFNITEVNTWNFSGAEVGDEENCFQKDGNSNSNVVKCSSFHTDQLYKLNNYSKHF